MSYQSYRPGPFVLSKLTTPYTYSNTTEFTLTLDNHYTSSGLIPYNPTISGLVFSDITTEKVGAWIVAMHKPTSGGKYGGDEPQATPGRGKGAATCGDR